MSNRNLFSQKEFPEWKIYDITNEKIEHIKKLWFNDINFMSKIIYEEISTKQYFKDILLYIQRKLYLNEPLNLCLSNKEVCDIIILPCETLNNEEKELTLDDYDDFLLSNYDKKFEQKEKRISITAQEKENRRLLMAQCGVQVNCRKNKI